MSAQPLKLIEYRFIVLEHSIEIYGGLIALVFAVVGIWLGLKVTRKEQVIVERELIVEREVMVPAGTPFALNEHRLQCSATRRIHGRSGVGAPAQSEWRKHDYRSRRKLYWPG
jgi:hypothetical protein